MTVDRVALLLLPPPAGPALAQTWPPFALVTGLLLAGVVADRDGVFTAVAGLLARLPGRQLLLYAVSMAVVAVTTVVLNLDTSVAFLTPVLVRLARRRQAAETPFLYGCVYMSNAASLLLPGSNLTNLLVFSGGVRGAQFARDMAAGWLAAVVVTGVLVAVLFRREAPRTAGVNVTETASGATRGRLGWLCVAVIVVLILALPQPALPVLATGGLAAATRVGSRTMHPRAIAAGVKPLLLALVFLAAIGLGVLARLWSGPAMLMRPLNSWQTATVGAVAAIGVNNLPAAVLLSSGPLVHARSLLAGLDIGPNLAVTGSLSALIWMRAARTSGAVASARRYSLGGAVIVPCSLAATLVAFALSGPSRL